MPGLPPNPEEARLLRHCQVTQGLGLAELVETAGRRSGTWWLLSRLVTELPQEPWLGELEAVLAAVDTVSADALGSESAALLGALRAVRGQPDGLVALAVDRTRLLGGVMQKEALRAPYESAVQGESMNGDLVLDVLACYREADLEDFSRELGPPDFLGSELRFMALLGYREMQAYQQGDAGAAGQWLARQRRFLDDHVLNWVPAHCERLGGLARTSFYSALFALLRRACLLDCSDLAQVSDWLAQGLLDAAVTPGYVT